jgi:hypothetical protein
MKPRAYGVFPSRRARITQDCTHGDGDGTTPPEVPDGDFRRYWGAIAWGSDDYDPRHSGYTFTPEQIKALPFHDYKSTVSFYTKTTGTNENTGWWILAIPREYGVVSMMAVGGFNYTYQFTDMEIDGVSYRVYFLAYPVWSSMSVLVK